MLTFSCSAYLASCRFLIVIYRRLSQLTRSPFYGLWSLELISRVIHFLAASFSIYSIAWNYIVVNKSPVVSCIFIVGLYNVYTRIPQERPPLFPVYLLLVHVMFIPEYR